MVAQTCDDKSDLVHHANTFCNPEKYAQIYSDVWCGEDRDAEIKTKCNNLNTWFSTQRGETHTDPHSCQASCSQPGPGCEACTNTETHFICEESGACLHRDLVCDGHPQCEYGEDEALELCKQKWLNNKVFAPYASFTCKSLMYPAMTILATACNGMIECYNGSDEDSCSDTLSIYFLITAVASIIMVYLVLEYLVINMTKNKGTQQTISEFDMENMFLKDKDENYFDFATHYEDKFLIEKTNTCLLHLIFTQSRDVIKEKCLSFYDLVAKAKNQNEQEIFCYLHNNFDSNIVKEVYKAKFPGLTEKLTDKVEKLFHRRFLTKIKDKVNKNENLDEKLSAVNAIRKVVSNFLDFFKDSYLAIYLMVIVGGPMAIVDFLTNFTSVIILSLMGTIIIPIITISISIAINGPHLLFSFGEDYIAQKKTGTIVALCLIFGPLIPLFILHSLQTTLRKAKRCARRKDQHANNLFEKLKVQKTLLASMCRIELGKKVHGN